MIPEGQRLEALAERLRAVEPVMPSPAAKIRAWNLVAASIEQSTTGRKAGGSWRRLALTAVAVAVLLLAGAVAASANSLPDSPFYPVKTALEQLSGNFAFTPSDRLSYHLDLARTRLTEAEAMIASHRTDLARQALEAMNEQLDEAAAVVAAEEKADPLLAAELDNRLQQAISVHDAQLAQMQAEVANPDAIAAISRARNRAEQALQNAAAPNGSGNHGAGSNAQGQSTTNQGQGNKGASAPHPTPKK